MRHRTLYMVFVLGALCALFWLVGAPGALAADQIVNNCSSDTELRGDLTAMQSSNGGTLTFNCGANSASIVLTGGILPTITTDTTIDGGGKITLSGNNGSPLFYVSSGAALTLNRITITKGFNNGDGGAIRNDGSLYINSSKFLENQVSNGSGGAIVSYGTVNITNSEFAYNKGDNGGAVYPRWSGGIVTITGSSFHHNETTSTTDGWGGALLLWDGATVTINASTLNDNKARDGGAVFVTGNSTLRLNTSTMRTNSASNPVGGGGAIYNNGTAIVNASTLSGNSATTFNYGGAILNSHGGTLTVTNSTLSGNTSGLYGGAIFNVGKGTVTSATLFGNSAESQGGGIWHLGEVGDTFTVKNTILVPGAKGGNCSQQLDSKTPITSGGFNLSSDQTCAATFNQGGDQNGKPALLGALGNNGGPTLTHLPSLNPPSPAIDNGACSGINTDQRDTKRPQGLACDIGAVEVVPPSPCSGTPPKPVLPDPKNGGRVKSTSPTLDWNNETCPMTYGVVVRHGSNTGARAFGKKNLPDSQVIVTKPLTRGQTYYWRVTAVNSSGKTKSDWWSFKVK